MRTIPKRRAILDCQGTEKTAAVIKVNESSRPWELSQYVLPSVSGKTNKCVGQVQVNGWKRLEGPGS